MMNRQQTSMVRGIHSHPLHLSRQMLREDLVVALTDGALQKSVAGHSCFRRWYEL